MAVSGANTHDMRLVEPTLKSFAVRRPRPKPGGRKQRFCGDKGYDYADTRDLVRRWGDTLHIKSRGEEAKQLCWNPRLRAHCWVVERSHSWLNRCRRLLIRWEKKAVNYEAMLHITRAVIMVQLAVVLR